MCEQIDPPESKEKCYAILADVSAIAEIIVYAESYEEAELSALNNQYEEINIRKIEVENITKVEEIE